MSPMQELAHHLQTLSFEGRTFECLPIQGAHEVLQVSVSELDALPIFLTFTPSQILCIVYLCKRDEIEVSRVAELHTAMLELNVVMPLSSFSIVDNYYALFGAMALSSDPEEICKELVTLAANSYDALEAIEEYLK